MNAEERQLITDLFDRLRSVGSVEKDREAEQLIVSLARQNSDAGYLLVQNVLVQEHLVQQQQEELQAMQTRIQDLEAMVPRQAPQAQASGNGSFLGGIFGGSKAQPAQRSSVPPVATRQAAPASPWGRTSNAMPAQAAPYQQAPVAQAAPGGGGGFMRSAMTTAAGVAGGMLAANAISNMMKGHSPSGSQPASASSDPNLGNNDPGTYTASPEQTYGSEQTSSQESFQADNNDPGTYSEPAPDTSWDGGGDVEL